MAEPSSRNRRRARARGLWPRRHREQQIRRILADHADQVIPAGGLDEIRSRIAARRPWWRRVWDRLTWHACDWRGDPIFPDDVRCRSGRRHEDETAAPGSDPGTAEADYLRGQPAMTRSIPRRAKDLRAGDVITHGPDHDRDVRWRVSARPKIDGYGVALIDVADLDAGGEPRSAWFDSRVELAVEPAGGAR